MDRRDGRSSATGPRRGLVVASVLGALVFTAASAAYAASVALDESFAGTTLNAPAQWNASTANEIVCLTARPLAAGSITLGNGVVGGCSNSTVDPDGQGVLRLTRAVGNQATTFLYNTALPLADGLDITFSLSMWGGSGADGISFFVKDGANTDDSPGAAGGSLGYGRSTSSRGIRGALVGIGLDRFGNFSGTDPAVDCAAPNATTGAISGPTTFAPNQIVVRGPDLSATQDGTCGYYYLGGAAHSFSTGADTRAGRAQDVRVFIDKPSVPDPKIKVYIGPTGALPTTPTVEVDQPAVFLTTSTFKFGFSASTGGFDNNHEVWGLNIGAAVPQAAPVAVWTPSLDCTPDPYRTGETVTCTVTGGPEDFDILWAASTGGDTFASRGVRLDALGAGTFSFAAPDSQVTQVELVDWGVFATLSRVDGSGLTPTRIPAGQGPTRAPLILVGIVIATSAVMLARGRRTGVA